MRVSIFMEHPVENFVEILCKLTDFGIYVKLKYFFNTTLVRMGPRNFPFLF